MAGIDKGDQSICKICNNKYKNSRGRNSHITRIHKEWDIGKYYETFYPNYCVVCNKLIKFKGEKYLQYKFCSKKCLKKAFSKYVSKNKNIKKYAEEELLNEIKELHKKYGGYVTQSLMRTSGKYNYQTYHDYFGSWVKACELAGVPHIKKQNYNYSSKNFDSHLTIQIDSREMQPYKFEDYIVKKLDVGDYAFADENLQSVVIERKSIKDMKTTFSGDLDRFKRELDRAREKDMYVVILVDCSREQFFKTPNLYGKMSNRAIYHNIKLITSQYADCCQFLFSGSKEQSNFIVPYILLYEKDYLASSDLQYLYNNNLELFEGLTEEYLNVLDK